MLVTTQQFSIQEYTLVSPKKQTAVVAGTGPLRGVLSMKTPHVAVPNSRTKGVIPASRTSAELAA
jgi:hypothetical protein